MTAEDAYSHFESNHHVIAKEIAPNIVGAKNQSNYASYKVEERDETYDVLVILQLNSSIKYYNAIWKNSENKTHRINSPAFYAVDIERNMIFLEHYYLNGKEFDNEKEYKSSPEYKEILIKERFGQNK